MGNIIPKIKIGKSSHRNKFDLSCMCHTTSEVGYMQPMFSKILSPHTTIKVGTKSLVRLSSMFVPTMGKLDLRIYHAFVPINTIWTPFDAFLTGTDFTLADGSQYKPTVAPSFQFSDVWEYLSKNELLGGSPNALYGSGLSLDGDYYRMVKYSEIKNYWFNTEHADYDPSFLFNQVKNAKVKSYFYGSQNGFIIKNDAYSGISTSDYEYLYCFYDVTAQTVTLSGYRVAGEFKVESVGLGGYSCQGPVPDTQTNDWSLALHTNANSDNLSKFTSLSLFSVRMRRLRKCFLGLGYAFNPFDDSHQTPFKLMAYYKAWYQLFYPQRDSNFFASNCYKLTKYMSENGVSRMYDAGSGYPQTSAFKLLCALIDDLCDIRYIMPLDYFSLADPLAEVRGASTGSVYGGGHAIGFNPHSVQTHNEDHVPIPLDTTIAGEAEYDGTTSLGYPAVQSSSEGYISALAMRTAMKLMRFVNKNTVVGKKVTDILRMRFGISDVHEQAHEAVYLVGSSKVDISISDVMSTAETETMALGDYAGKGIGFGESKYFTFDTGANTGVFISFAAVVPMTGYYQGMLRENSMGVGDRFDFYSPEFDALGYQDVLYNELVADLMHETVDTRSGEALGTLPAHATTDCGSIGYVPRYTHLKVSKDVCNGDISLYSRHDAMLPYTLDRYFGSLPDMTPENFRSLNITDFNRIFNSKSSWDDHFILQTMFDVSMWSDMKSIASTFDTFDDDGDTDTIEMSHQ